MGPLSGLMFLVGVIMILVGRNRNNDDLFEWGGFSYRKNDGEFERIRFLIIGILLVAGAVVMWIYMLINGDPDPPPDYNSLMNKNSSQ